MADILETIIEQKRKELNFSAMPDATNFPPAPPSMREALEKSQSGIIAEFKRRSPSKGWIKEEGRADEIPLAYSNAGAAAISVLTDETFFGGSLDFLRTASAKIEGRTPLLRKDFIISESQILEARLAGASAVLLIAACLSLPRYRELLTYAHQLGLEVLLEIHQESEFPYIDAESLVTLDHPCSSADMVGVNNRNLGTFHTDVENSFRLAALLPKDRLLVSESGISNPETIKRLRAVGYRGFLIGETFMKTPDPGEALRAFITEVEA